MVGRTLQPTIDIVQSPTLDVQRKIIDELAMKLKIKMDMCHKKNSHKLTKVVVSQSFNVARCFLLQILHPEENTGSPSVLWGGGNKIGIFAKSCGISCQGLRCRTEVVVPRELYGSPKEWWNE